MCCCKPQIGKKGGLVFIILFGAFSVAALVFACIDYKGIKYDWADVGKWDALASLLISAACLVIVMTFIGIVYFTCCTHRCFGIIFVILQSLICVFAVAISALSLVASVGGNIKDYAGCKTEYKGILKMYTNIDYLLKAMDVALCSNDCQCKFDEATKNAFEQNTTTKTYFQNWKNGGANDRFQNCSETIRKNVETTFQQYDTANGGYLKSFTLSSFTDFWEYIENKFECSGWCETEYTYTSSTGTKTTEQRAFYKYLTSGVNRGIVKNLGCLDQVLDWIPGKLLIYGVLGLICSCSGILAIFFALVTVCSPNL